MLFRSTRWLREMYSHASQLGGRPVLVDVPLRHSYVANSTFSWLYWCINVLFHGSGVVFYSLVIVFEDTCILCPEHDYSTVCETIGEGRAGVSAYGNKRHVTGMARRAST